jgi:hypothetical protein
MIRSSWRISLQDREREMVAGCRGHKLDLKAKGRKGEVFEKGPDTPLQEFGLLSPPCSAGEVARSTLKSHGVDDSSRSVESSLRRFLDPARLGKIVVYHNVFVFDMCNERKVCLLGLGRTGRVKWDAFRIGKAG